MIITKLDQYTRNLVCLYFCVFGAVVILGVLVALDGSRNGLMFMALITLAALCGCMTVCVGITVFLSLHFQSTSHVNNTSSQRVAPMELTTVNHIMVQPSAQQQDSPIVHPHMCWVVDVSDIKGDASLCITTDSHKVVILQNP